jgi:hypothetical protein
MNDPWQILILDANTATEKDVKAAYARLLKQHRPDADPEGFRRVREAYEIALAMVRERDAQGTPPPAYAQATREGGEADQAAPVVSDFAPPSLELPAAVEPSFAEVERAAASGNAEQLEAALQAFHAQCESARVEAAMRANALERACAGNVKLLAAAVSDLMLLRLAELGQVNVPHMVVSEWVEEERRERIAQFGGAVLDRARQLATPEGGLLMARVGVMVGLELPKMAASLGNLAFPHLPVDLRAQIMAQLEHEAALGQVFEEVTPEMKPFWFARLRNNSEAQDWGDAHAVRALDDLVQRNRYMWQGWGIIQQLLPPERWEKVESRLRQQAQQVAQSTPRRSKVPVWLVVVPIVIVLNLVRMISESSAPSRNTSFSASGSRPTTSQQRNSQEEFKRKIEQWKAQESWRIPQPLSSGTRTIDTMPSLMDINAKRPLTVPNSVLSVPQPLGTPLFPPGTKPATALPAPGSTKGSDDHLRSLLDGPAPARPAR